MKLYDIIDNMDRIQRFSGTYNIKPQLLSSHTLRVAVLAWELSKGNVVNSELLFMIAICHDMEETFCGDIIHPIKKYFKDYKGTVNDILRDNLEDERLFTFFNNKDTLEGYLVELADMIDTPMQALKEIERGNLTHKRYFDKFNTFMADQNNIYYLNTILTRENVTMLLELYDKTGVVWK